MRKSNKEISIIIPTRGRFGKLIEMMDSALNLASSPELIEFVLYIDNDDPSYEALDRKVVIIRGNRIDMGLMNNLCIQKSTGRIIMLCNDDVIVRTEKWDDTIYKSAKVYDDNMFLLYPNDLHKGSHLCAFPIFSKELYLRYPGIFPEKYKGAFIDSHILDVFVQLKGLGVNRIKYLSNVIFEHLHYTIGKSKFDKTYSDRGRFSDDDSFILYSNLRIKLSCKIANDTNEEPLCNHNLNRSPVLEKMNSFQFIKKNTLMFLLSNAPFLYRSKLWIYMISRRVYKILMHLLKDCSL